MKSKLLILLFGLVITISTMHISLLNDPFCFKIPSSQTQKNDVKFHYYAQSQDHQHQNSLIQVQIVSAYPHNNKQTLYKNLKTVNGQLLIEKDTNTSVCFKPINNQQIIFVTFDFYPNHHSVIKDIASKSQFYQLHQQLMGFADKLQDIRYNQEIFQQNQEIHHRLINNYEGTMWNCALGKLLLIIVIMSIQFYILKKVFKKSESNHSNFGF